ncbi:MAG: flagellar hook-basal body complex protein FliE [Gammaproteobacteria bacterium HGW-Gammaproteobacteria-7]|nr:MAG: flagellar hook-basal body complex protein FliE [Gammaproteobacteria bacterium HGW-Gammaproteobacteria-7]
MSDAIASVLSQIRSLQSQTRPAASAPVSVAPTGGEDGFAKTLSSALGRVNQSQMKAGELMQAFEQGDPRADLARVMVAAQQSQVEFRATVEVRNRLIQAYQDVMNMPL